mmetsp:Transcript_16220/g.26443  ORF Transcript_16220/g.26443 Transcript_16220/m.26443 type:complete len:946 (+) Transcript_16220:424-3261(+)|eukprot:CAMPEP_0203763078 /NCGR_PEP_ID=MMETSP0098-20131031/15777_1 /ASSEMBLY_ACC=CAM_ASM_000208 /TAXON_ID=96639 /ORGANISM=" , Strain NY0313808BC1" /LENGTH=945 /DNA_ID=CAMNT_0050657681 /DNA_START=408 /DNA_END=3248 /DNA_ORIENTATION=+
MEKSETSLTSINPPEDAGMNDDLFGGNDGSKLDGKDEGESGNKNNSMDFQHNDSLAADSINNFDDTTTTQDGDSNSQDPQSKGSAATDGGDMINGVVPEQEAKGDVVAPPPPAALAPTNSMDSAIGSLPDLSFDDEGENKQADNADLDAANKTAMEGSNNPSSGDDPSKISASEGSSENAAPPPSVPGSGEDGKGADGVVRPTDDAQGGAVVTEAPMETSSDSKKDDDLPPVGTTSEEGDKPDGKVGETEPAKTAVSAEDGSTEQTSGNSKEEAPPPPPPETDEPEKTDNAELESSNIKTNSKTPGGKSEPTPQPLSKSSSSSSKTSGPTLKRSSSSASSALSRKRSKGTKSKKKELTTKEQAIVWVLPFCDLDTLTVLTMVCKGYKDAVVASKDWKLRALSMVKSLNGHIGAVNVMIKVSSFVFSGSSDGKIKIWNTRSWACERTVNVSNLPPNPMSQHAHPADTQKRFFPKGKRPHYTHDDGESEQTNAVTALAVLDKVLFIGLEDGYLIIRMILESKDSRTENRRIRAHNGAVRAIAVLSKHQRIFTGGADKVISVWDSTTYQALIRFEKHTDVVTALEVSGSRLFSGGQDSKLFVWNVQALKFEKSLEKQNSDKDPNLKKSFGIITALTAHENKLYSASWDCFIRVWDAKKLTLLREVFNHPVGVCWSLAVRTIKNQRTTLVCGVRDGDVELRSIDKQNTLEKLSCDATDNWCTKLNKHADWILCVLPLPDGRIVTGSADWSIKVWEYRFAPPIPSPTRPNQSTPPGSNPANPNSKSPTAAPMRRTNSAKGGAPPHPGQHPGYSQGAPPGGGPPAGGRGPPPARGYPPQQPYPPGGQGNYPPYGYQQGGAPPTGGQQYQNYPPGSAPPPRGGAYPQGGDSTHQLNQQQMQVNQRRMYQQGRPPPNQGGMTPYPPQPRGGNNYPRAVPQQSYPPQQTGARGP